MRDYFMGKIPQDFDIVVLAPLSFINCLAAKSNWRIKIVRPEFGTALIISRQGQFEVTSISDLWTDLSRRDFTVNAMAMDINGNIFDPFNGAGDIARKTLRAVGNAQQRFKEDPLRRLRALRFAAEYGFEIHGDTMTALPGALNTVSLERVQKELQKIITARYASTGLKLLLATNLNQATCFSQKKGFKKQIEILPELNHLVGLKQNQRYHRFDVWQHTLAVVENLPPETTLRWAALLHDIAKGLPGVRGINKRGEISDYGHAETGVGLAAKILTRLKIPAKKRICWLIRQHMNLPKPRNLIRWLRKQAVNFSDIEELKEAVQQLLKLAQADLSAGKTQQDLTNKLMVEREQKATAILAEVPFYPKQLAISGGTVAKVLGEGVQIKEFLAALLLRVQSGELENQTEVLIKVLAKKKSKI